MALPNTLLSAAEHVLTQRFWGFSGKVLLWDSKKKPSRLLRKKTAFENHREEGALAIGDLANTKHIKVLNGQGNVQIRNIRTHAKRIEENVGAARQSATLTRPFYISAGVVETFSCATSRSNNIFATIPTSIPGKFIQFKSSC